MISCFSLKAFSSSEEKTSEKFIAIFNVVLVILRVYIDGTYIGPNQPQKYTYLGQGTFFEPTPTGNLHRPIL